MKPLGDRRFTLLLVPEGGGGEVRQISIPLSAVRRAVVASVAVAVCFVAVLVAGVAALPQVAEHDGLVADNRALRDRIADLDQRLQEIEPLVTRVRAYDEKLRTLEARQVIPGFGPLDEEEARARQDWIEGVAPRFPKEAEDPEGDALLARMAGVEDDLAALSPGLADYEGLLSHFETWQRALPVIWPVEGVITSEFGMRRSPFTRQWKMHTGLDIGAVYGSPILATNDGLVTFSGWDQGHGNMIAIEHADGVTTRYCHASRLLVSEGDVVSAGDIIALVGSTGMSTGPHLHYEILVDGEKVDPLEYLP